MTKKEAKEIMCKVTFYWELGEQTLTQNQINEAIDLAIKALEQQPKTGHWINLERTKYKGQVLPFWDRYECSECGNHGQGDFNFCPNCGARMEAEA